MARNFIIAAGICVVAGIILAAFDFHGGQTDSFFLGSKSPEAFEQYKWTRVTESAAFSKSYNFQLLTHHDTLWAFHPDGNYFSLNGKNWTKSGLTNIIYNLAFLDYVPFNNSILGLGHLEGNIEKFTLTTEVNKTTDLKSWQLLAKESNLPKRFFYHPFVFNNKIWIVGGSDGKETYSDIWNSVDGVKWTKVADNAPFGKKDRQQFVVFKNKIFMLDNEVWTSGDGINWNLLTSRITWAPLFGYTPVVFDEKIWLIGCNRSGKFTSEVMVSCDGKSWEAQTAPWSPRGGVAAAVYHGKIYMTGGKYGALFGEPDFVYSNDVWTLEKVR